MLHAGDQHVHASQASVIDAGVFGAASRTIVAAGNTPFLLGQERVWLLHQGRVDIFAVQVVSGEPIGVRIHLLRAEAGQALFGIEPESEEGFGLLAVAGPDTTLVELPLAAVHQALSESERVALIVTLIEAWIEALYQGLAPTLCPSRVTSLVAGADAAVAAGTVAQPLSGVCWVRPAQAGCVAVGHECAPLQTDVFFPLARPGWLEARRAVQLDVRATHMVCECEGPWKGLRHLHTALLRLRADSAQQAAFIDGERIARRAASHRLIISRASARLAASSSAPEVRSACASDRGQPAAADDDPLLAAFRIVADATGVAIKAPTRREGSRSSLDRLQRVLAASRIRSRRVALRGDWWRHDHGALLAYTAEEKRPVAFLWRGREYVMRDPARRTLEPVGPKNVATLEPFARIVYRPFPESVLRVRDLVRFGLVGCGSDLRRVVLLTLATMLLGLVPPIATAHLFNTVIPSARRFDLLQFIWILAICGLCTAMFNVARGIALLRIEGRMGSAIQAAVWDRLLGLPLAFFRPYTAGDLATRAMAIDTMRQLLSTTTVSALLGGVLSLGGVGLMFYYSAELAWRASLLIALSVAVTITCGALQLRPQQSVARLQAKTSGLVLQLLSGIARLRLSAAEAPAFALWAERFSEQRRLQYKSRTIGNAVAALHAAFPVATHLAIFWAAAPKLADAPMRTGDFLGFLTAFSACLNAVLATSAAALGALNVIPLYEQARPILEALPEVDSAKAEPGVLLGNIEIHHAMFRYEADGPLVLRDLSFNVRPGEFIAFVGPSGSGKSTLLRLLLGFEGLESGSIYYDGQEIGGLDLAALRRQIGVVLQSGRLMAGDILTNIVGSASATLEEAWEAAHMAGFADDIKTMPMGMHTVISDGGGTLSGGQRQRLMIARAIVHRPRILLFDEATSALDNRTQAIVSKSLEKLQATRIVVAHRLTTIINADRIFVINRGEIVESGSYADLMHQGGLFATLARRQIH